MHLCSAHMEMLGDELQSMKANLKPGHVIHTLVCEHDMILGFLDKLEKTNQTIQEMNNFSRDSEEFDILKHIADHLIGAEPHHQREEEILFPELEKRGVFGPPQIMRMEHEQLRARKKTLKELSDTVEQLDFNSFKKQLDTTVRFIVPTLRDHIFKENNILYPTALKVITDEELWKKLKEACDEVGYCCFTPET